MGEQELRDEIARLNQDNERLRAALNAIVAAYNGNSHPVHYKVREAIDAARGALLDDEED